MCAILLTTNVATNETSFRKALRMMRHRGPDASGYLYSKGCRLGHNRLKVIDLDNRSNQPFRSADNRFIIIFNGEIYNYRELAKQYCIKQRTNSDTEVIVELYARFGPRCLPWLNGMFAFAILDTVTNQVFVARDRLGVKPLYMDRRGGSLTVSSEIAPLLFLSGHSKWDDLGIRQYRKLRAFFNGRTAYENIKMFPQGCYMLDGALQPYWKLPEGEKDPPSDKELRELICEAVDQRLVSDVPVGSYLSGGLDSTIVAALAHKPDTWTVGFEEHNEFEWGRIAASHIKSNHHEIVIDPEEFVSLAKEMIQIRREPLSVPNEVLLYKMTREVKKRNTVVMSGEGADELFFGYDRIFRWAAASPSWNSAEFAKLYAYGSHDDLEIVDDALKPFMHHGHPLKIVAHFFQIAHLHGLLRRLDNSTMLCSVEARVPFVDHHPLVERMAGVSFDYKMQGGDVKDPLKRVFRDLIPEQIIQRHKVGFPVPLELIPFGDIKGATPMDRWLEFNLAQLGAVDL